MKDKKCYLCNKPLKKEECSKDYKVPICKKCARDLQYYGSD
jgi:hypothetical protein